MKQSILLLLFILQLPLTVLAQDSKTETLPRLRFPLSAATPTLDFTEAEDFISIRLLLNLGDGLISLDPKLTPQKALAESYTISSDGRTYTFKIKKAKWSNEDLITSQDFIYGFKRTLSPETIAKVASPFIELIEGAKDFKTKKTSDFNKVGIKALDDSTLQFKLKKSSNYFLQLLALPFSFPQKSKTEGSHKLSMPTTGAYVISENSSPSQLIFVPNKFHEPKAKNEVEFKITTDASTQMSLYEKNEIDVLERVPTPDFERFQNSKELHKAPFLATYYLGFNIQKKPFDSLQVRKLISSAIQREEIQKILKDPQIISSALIPTPLVGSNGKYIPKVTADEKTEGLKKLESQSIQLVFDTQEKNTLISALIQQQLKKTLKLQILLKNYEWKSYIKLLTDERPSFFRFAWLAAFPDPLSHLTVFTSESPNNYTGFSNQYYDQLIEKISQLKDGPKRLKLIDEAQRILIQEQSVIIPIYHYQQYSLIKKDWEGLKITPMGLLYFSEANLKRGP